MKPICAHCGERVGGAEDTVWCAECLEEWRREYFKELNGRYPTEADKELPAELRPRG